MCAVIQTNEALLRDRTTTSVPILGHSKYNFKVLCELRVFIAASFHQRLLSKRCWESNVKRLLGANYIPKKKQNKTEFKAHLAFRNRIHLGAFPLQSCRKALLFPMHVIFFCTRDYIISVARAAKYVTAVIAAFRGRLHI